MPHCSFCGRAAVHALKVRGLALCPDCEARLVTISAGSAGYAWFQQAVRRALLCRARKKTRA